MKEVELHPSEVKKDTATHVKLGCLSRFWFFVLFSEIFNFFLIFLKTLQKRCDGSAVLMSKLGSCCVGVMGPVEAKEKDQDPIRTICIVHLHPPSGKHNQLFGFQKM